MSSGGSTQNSTTTTSVPSWLQDAATGYLGTANQVASQPYTPYDGQRVADLSPLQQSSIQGIGNLAGGTGSMGANEGFLQDLAGGAYMNNPGSAENPYGGFNPFFQGQMQTAFNDISRQFNDTTAENMNRFRGPNRNSSAYEQVTRDANDVFARRLGEAANTAYGGQFDRSANLAEQGLNRQSNNFNAGVGQMLAGVGASTGLGDAFGRTFQNALSAGGMEQGQNQRLLDSLYSDFLEQRNYPAQQLGLLGNAVSSIFGGNRASTQNTSTQLPGQDPFSTGLGLYMLASGGFR